MFGQQLLQNNHYASDEVKDRLQELADARQKLEQYVNLAPLFTVGVSFEHVQ